jgi:hypothetical protein
MLVARAEGSCMRSWSCLLLAAGLAVWPRLSHADSEKTFDYRYDSVWSSAIRYIRAEKGYPIKDQDRENGYILFIYPGTGSVKECAASLQIIRIIDDRGFKKVRAKLTIEHLPSYVEVHFLDKLEQKLRDDYGNPPPPEREPSKDEKPKEPPKDQPKEPPTKQ